MEFVESSDSSEDDNEVQNFVELIANGSDNSEVLSTAEVFEMMELETERVHSVLKLPKIKTRALLNKYKWDSERLLECFYEDNDNILLKSVNADSKLTRNICNYNTCDVCLDDFHSSEMTGLDECYHRYCNFCWENYITTVVQDGGLMESIKCAAPKCLAELEDEVVLQLLNSNNIKKKYQRQITYSFVQNNPLLRWCPSINCDNAIKVQMKKQPESVRCKCGCWFCFECNGPSHDPVPCEMLSDWDAVKNEILEISSWILKFTKQCTQCKFSIEKTGGCNHMVCRNCKNEFCWICMTKWKPAHNCVPFIEKGETHTGDLRRFMISNAKTAEMQQSITLDENLYKTKQILTELELKDQWIKVEFVKDAVELLLQCRRTLMHSYIFNYFTTTDDNQIFIFEDNQKGLQTATENLSELLENAVTAENVHIRKEKIMINIEYCKARRRALIDHVIEGMENDLWKKFPNEFTFRKHNANRPAVE